MFPFIWLTLVSIFTLCRYPTKKKREEREREKNKEKEWKEKTDLNNSISEDKPGEWLSSSYGWTLIFTANRLVILPTKNISEKRARKKYIWTKNNLTLFSCLIDNYILSFSCLFSTERGQISPLLLFSEFKKKRHSFLFMEHIGILPHH